MFCITAEKEKNEHLLPENNENRFGQESLR